jgi:UDP-glucose 4-epimerase
MKKILVTGGCGYIGSHTLVDLIESGFEVISVDSNARSSARILEGVEKITKQKIKNYKVDLCNYDDTFAIFQENEDIAGVIHFAAYKSVAESVEEPLLYFENNLVSLINLLKCIQEFEIPHFVFSSSCTVYGNPVSIPVTEETLPTPAESPYGYTKQMGEQIISEFSKAHTNIKCVLLRYFNPAGAHPSIQIGEMPIGKPSYLIPTITQTAIGKLPKMKVFGSDYDTRDGTCVRDFVHVCDIAHAHTLCLQYLMNGTAFKKCEVFNLGTGTGVTVLEAIKAFEKVAGIQLNYGIGPRRSGDVVSIYANNERAQEILEWSTKYSLEDMMLTAWKWEQRLSIDEKLFNKDNTALN